MTDASEQRAATKSDRVSVFVRDYRAAVRVGLRDHEKQGPQTLVINIEIESLIPHRFDDPTEESLDRAIDYTQAYRFIRDDLQKRAHIPLLESVAEIIINHCFEDVRVSRVRVRLEKPGIFPDAAGAGVDIERQRNAS